jgi:hypothetical protein
MRLDMTPDRLLNNTYLLSRAVGQDKRYLARFAAQVSRDDPAVTSALNVAAVETLANDQAKPWRLEQAVLSAPEDACRRFTHRRAFRRPGVER